ncbi:MAG TPA: DUF397 domain-containing protein [Pseudonocardiaceae bacterium]|nr:DUF397 domain-containing protein [Pseudonocardiaceae bacterium]
MTVYSHWHRSTHGGAENNCVETRKANYDDGTTAEQVQDSKNPSSGRLSFHPNEVISPRSGRVGPDGAGPVVAEGPM